MNDRTPARQLRKVKTLITGLDEVLQGGFPRGRTVLISGGPGSGKTVLALEFLYRRALQGEPGIFVAFEERTAAIRENALTLGWDLSALEKAGKLALIEGHIDPDAVLSGELDVRGLLGVIEGIARTIGAEHIVLDAVDVLLRMFDNPGVERNQLYSLHEWLQSRGMTNIFTIKAVEDGMRGRYEFMDFMADCVVRLEQRSLKFVSTRELQVIKYRGSGFGRNAYPFVIAQGGVQLIPISMFGLQHQPLGPHMPSGSSELDEILGGGYRRGSSILIGGVSGTGKTTLAATFAASACGRGDKLLYLGFEESTEAMVTSMLSPGIDLRPAMQAGRLRMMTSMPEAMGTEQHVIWAITEIDSFHPDHVIVDALSAFKRMGSERAAFEFAMRLINYSKDRGITVLLTNQSRFDEGPGEISGMGISSIIDTAIYLGYAESNQALSRYLLVIKSRGSKHSTQYHLFDITDEGIKVEKAPPAVQKRNGGGLRFGSRNPARRSCRRESSLERGTRIGKRP